MSSHNIPELYWVQWYWVLRCSRGNAVTVPDLRGLMF